MVHINISFFSYYFTNSPKLQKFTAYVETPIIFFVYSNKFRLTQIIKIGL